MSDARHHQEPSAGAAGPAGVAGVVLTHGAGSDRDHATLRALDEGLDLPVARLDFPYRQQGRKAPDRAPKLVAFLVEEVPAIAERWGTDPARLVLGGRSMGGRICSLVAAGDRPEPETTPPLPAAGLVLVSYPLHPPGKPEQLRIEHFPRIEVPCLFISGDRDPFATPDELAHHVAAIPGPVTTVFLPGRHDLAGHDDEIVTIVASWLASAPAH